MRESVIKFLGRHIQKLVLLNQFAVITYLVVFLDKKILLSDKVALFFVFIMLLGILLASFTAKKYKNMSIRSILVLVVVIWQHLFIININLRTLGVLLQPLLVYGYIVVTIDNILYGNVMFKKKYDRAMWILMCVVSIVFILEQLFFNILYYLYLLLMYIYPLSIMLIYKEQIKTMPKSMKKMLCFFQVYLILDGAFIIFVEEYFLTSNDFENIGWYISIGIIIYFFYTKLLYRIWQEEVFFWGLDIINLAKKISILIIVLILHVNIIFRFSFKENYFIASVILLFFSGVAVFFQVNVVGERVDENKKFCAKCDLAYIDVLRQLESEEELKKEIALYLHDEVLQNIIAIKNLIFREELKYFEKEIHDDLKTVIETLRNEIDFYHPVISKNYSLKQNYINMIEELLSVYYSEKEINFLCDENFILLKPYDVLIYRFLKELVNNSLKHSFGKRIDIELKNNGENISVYVFSEDNKIKHDDIEMVNKGKGLQFMREQVDRLRGSFKLNIVECKGFLVEIEMPLLEEKCYEYFINR